MAASPFCDPVKSGSRTDILLSSANGKYLYMSNTCIPELTKQQNIEKMR